ncbi:DUF2254 domain-containing protein [Histidinibacterium aquaticum]|uniref:DUF2254 domain-containing protein n=1 Tax=Histidinibacterium aquaticum TaxID=2613962 RepID=A0A5J5GFU4_9RHOB|nr:DUF2254 domain-containing protein [Histidinibacterium aquaticum]KAA9006648.1 DUF2254 domain-containing protein [Histidinibacterium aquaticum]
MRNFIVKHAAQLRENYWFWPMTMTLLAVVLGFALPRLDAAIGTAWIKSVPFLREIQADGARAILTTLASSSLGVAGVAFSMTIVAVSFASANYGPRLIGNFMSDRVNQLVLGILVSTSVYCITVLSTVYAPGETSVASLEAFVPQVSVSIALLLVLISIGALIGYIHHIPESINIMTITSGLGSRLHQAVLRLIEGGPELDRETAEVGVLAERESGAEQVTLLASPASGYVQYLDLEKLRSTATERRFQITVLRAPGDFVASQETLISVSHQGSFSGQDEGDLLSCITIGQGRTTDQDVLFLSDQLVEVMIRALSPGVNDPHTAMQCLDWLKPALLAFAAATPIPQTAEQDRLRYRRVSFVVMLDRTFDRIRQHVAADWMVVLHALELLTDLSSAASHPESKLAVDQQLDLLAQAAEELLPDSGAREEVRRLKDASRA